MANLKFYWRRLVYLLTCVVCCVLVVHWYNSPFDTFWMFTGNTKLIDLNDRPPYDAFDVYINNPQKKKRVILLWTPFFGDSKWNTVMNKYQCASCVVTDDRRLLVIADVVVFHCRDFFWYSHWPAFVSHSQIYAVVCHESPNHSSLYYFRNRMNMTITYRVESDAFLGWKFIVKAPTNKYTPKILFHKKTKMAVWPVSHCSTPSKREKYVAELSKHIDVDIYGKCGTHTCPRSKTHECQRTFESRYKFYFAFENSVCRDYVTEKLAEPLQFELVPVVYGGADYTQCAPPHSVINARDFASPALLAKYLLYVANNETAYNEYFKWKGQFNFTWSGNYFCKMCELAASGSYHKEYKDLDKWWSDGTCDDDITDTYLKH